MFSVLRLAYGSKCPRYAPLNTDSILNDLLIKGSYMPWQIQNKQSLYHENKREVIVKEHCFHEAGHALTRVYEDQEDRLYNLKNQLKFLGDFDTPKNGWGKKAGMHEARAHAFSILLQRAIDPKYIITDDIYCNVFLIAGHCASIAYGIYDDPKIDQQFKDEIDRILEEITPAEALVMWQELCSRLYAHQQTIDMDEMDKNINTMVADAILMK